MPFIAIAARGSTTNIGKARPISKEPSPVPRDPADHGFWRQSPHVISHKYSGTGASTEGAVNQNQNLDPFGLVGLSLSLVGILLLALVISVMIGGSAILVAIIVIGRSAMADDLRHAGAGLQQSQGGGALPLLLGISLIVYLAVALAILAFARWRGGRAWRSLVAWRPLARGFKDKVSWSIGGAALIYSVAATAALSYFYPESQSWFTMPADKAAVVLLFILAVVLAPITEELLFRGWIYTSLRFRFGLWPALLVTSALFGLAHYENTHLYALAVFPVGLALAAIRERTGSVKGSMLFHAFNNFIAFCAAALDKS
jgi:uncharacterized protein